MTDLIIEGKRTTPTRHSVVGYTIVGCEQMGDTITALQLERSEKFFSNSNTPHNTTKKKRNIFKFWKK